jgi:hypothetical protein
MSDKKESEKTKQEVQYKLDRMVASKDALLLKTDILTTKTQEFNNGSLLVLTKLQTSLGR